MAGRGLKVLAQQVEMQQALARGAVLVLMRARTDVRMHMHVQQR